MRELFLERGRIHVHKVPEKVAVDVPFRAHFDAGNDANFGVVLLKRPDGVETDGGIVIGDGQNPDMKFESFREQRLRTQRSVGGGGMRVEINGTGQSWAVATRRRTGPRSAIGS